MKEVAKNLFVGSDADCLTTDYAVVHACKSCHQQGVGYTGSLKKSHPHYLIFEQDDNLYLNMVDMERELLAHYTHGMMSAAFNFIDTRLPHKPVLIHCNMGMSRSASVALLYLARKSQINATSYIAAATDFAELYPPFSLGTGVQLYLQNNWDELMRL